MSSLAQIQVGIDVGGRAHRVAVAVPHVCEVEEFSIGHDRSGFKHLFDRLALLERTHALPVAVAMEGYNGHARPLDREIQARG